MLESIILRKEYRWKLKRNIGGEMLGRNLVTNLCNYREEFFFLPETLK